MSLSGRGKRLASVWTGAPIALLALLLAACGSMAGNTESEPGTDEASGLIANEESLQADNEGARAIILQGSTIQVEGAGAIVKGTQVTIVLPGVYVVSGQLDDGQIIVDLASKGTVQLILNGASIHNAKQAPIYVASARETVITLQAGTENFVSDGTSYVYASKDEDEPNATIFSKDDLVIDGAGTLTVNANYNNAIMSKDNLTIAGGTIVVHSVDDGLVGRDLVLVRDGQLTIRADGDGIKSTNDEDAAKGRVVIAGGILDIQAGADGIQAVTDIAIEGGTIAVDSGDDAVHSDNRIAISGGELTIAAGDDAIHADASIDITAGTVNIRRSYEGIESMLIAISGGEIHVVASDDGINIAGGNDGSAAGGRRGPDAFASSGAGKLSIHGGYVAVYADGDGLDSNGSIEMTGGTVLVHGPTMNGNGALDYDGSFEMTGGILIAAGSSGMAAAPGAQSGQPSILMYYAREQQAGTLVHLADSAGNAIATFAPDKNYQSIVISSPALKQGETYTLYAGGTSTGAATDGLYADGVYQGGAEVVTFTVANQVTYVSETGAATGGRGGPGGGGRGGR